jgi:hypothetical protein
LGQIQLLYVLVPVLSVGDFLINGAFCIDLLVAQFAAFV